MSKQTETAPPKRVRKTPEQRGKELQTQALWLYARSDLAQLSSAVARKDAKQARDLAEIIKSKLEAIIEDDAHEGDE